MATKLAPAINITNVSSGMKSLNTGLGNLKKSSDTIKTVTLNRTKIKRESFARDKMLTSMREEAVRRKDQESIIEASGIGGAMRRTTSVIADSTKGFLGRVMDFGSSLLIGWLLFNLPTIMTAIEDLIIRIKSLTGLLTDFMSNIGDTFRNFGSLLSGVYQDIIHFDFTDQSKRVQSAMDDLNVNLETMRDQFMQGFDMLSKPLGEGPGEKPVPELNTDYRQSDSTTGGGQDLYTLATIANLESGSAQGQADVAQSIYNRMKKSGKGVVDVTTSPGQYQPFFGKSSKDIDPQSKNIRTFDDAVKYRMKKTGENRATAERSVLSTISAIQDPSKQAAAREFIGTRTSFRGSPQNTGNTLRNVSWRGSKSDNQFLNEEVVGGSPGTVPSFVTSPTKSTQPTGASGNVITVGKGILNQGFSVAENKYFTKFKGFNPKGDSPVGGHSSKDHGTNALDVTDWKGSEASGIPRLKNLFLSLYSSRQKYGIKALIFDPIGYWFTGMKDYKREAYGGHHNHLHVGFTKSADTALKSDKELGIVDVSAPSSSTPLAQVSSRTQPGQNVPSVAQDRKGQQIIIADSPQQPQPQQVSAGGGGSQLQMIPTESSLNSLIKNQILLELAYT
jgi:hypothetical protein